MEGLSFNIFNIIILLVSIQGFLLVFIFFFNEKFKKPSNQALTVLLLAIALQGIHMVFYDTGMQKNYPVLGHLPITFIFGIPIGFYYFVHFLINPDSKLTNKDYLFISPLILLAIISIIEFTTFVISPKTFKEYEWVLWNYEHLRETLAIIYLAGVIFFVNRKVDKYHSQLFNNYSEVEGKDLHWLKKVIWAVVGLLILWVISQISNFFYNVQLYYPTWIGMCFLVYWLGYFIILRQDIFVIPSFTKEERGKKQTLSDNTIQHYDNLLSLMESEKLYRNPEINMTILAESMKLSNGYLSQIINQKEGKNFYDFINAYRVEEVKSKLRDPAYNHYSILAIGLDAGFKSKSTFNAVFKKMTGMTPSTYKKQKA